MKPISSSSWANRLKTALSRLAKTDSPARIALLGVGNELRGDDAAGSLVARALREKLPARPDRLVLDAGGAPENFTGPLRRFQPGLIILVDAAQMGAQPGEVRWLEMDEVDGVSSFTHTLPLPVMARYLTEELGSQVALIGIQPVSTGLDDPVDPLVEEAIREVVEELARQMD